MIKISEFYNADQLCVSKVFKDGKRFYVTHFIESLDLWESDGCFDRKQDAENHAKDYAFDA